MTNNTGYCRLGDFFLDNIPAINLTSITQLEVLLGFRITGGAGNPNEKPHNNHEEGCLCGYYQQNNE